MTDLVAVDIGGTHARFALARIEEDGTVSLADPVTLKTADHTTLQSAWEAYGRTIAQPLPRLTAIAIAGPTVGDVLTLTNNPWVIHPGLLKESLDVDACTLVNDFEAVGHAVAQSGPEDFQHLCGPDFGLPEDGVISIIGPGTGLGVAHLWRGKGCYRVQPTEGGHIDFAPLDAIEDAMLARLRKRHRRVSVERIVSGPGLVEIHATLAALDARPVTNMDDKSLWAVGLSGEDGLAVAAIERFCQTLGSVAGDIALAHGANAVVIAGGLGYRLRDVLHRSGFAARFRAKGRFESLMASLPVKLITHPQPGLFGAAAAFARDHRS
jgi:glucokinase